jgi:hypothetical protein
MRDGLGSYVAPRTLRTPWGTFGYRRFRFTLARRLFRYPAPFTRKATLTFGHTELTWDRAPLRPAPTRDSE